MKRIKIIAIPLTIILVIIISVRAYYTYTKRKMTQEADAYYKNILQQDHANEAATISLVEKAVKVKFIEAKNNNIALEISNNTKKDLVYVSLDIWFENIFDERLHGGAVKLWFEAIAKEDVIEGNSERIIYWSMKSLRNYVPFDIMKYGNNIKAEGIATYIKFSDGSFYPAGGMVVGGRLSERKDLENIIVKPIPSE